MGKSKLNNITDLLSFILVMYTVIMTGLRYLDIINISWLYVFLPAAIPYIIFVMLCMYFDKSVTNKN